MSFPPPPSSTGAAAADADVPPPTTSNDLDIRRTLDYILIVQAAYGQIFVDCVQSWHSFVDPHRHLLLMMDFDCTLAFRHKKGEYIFEHL